MGIETMSQFETPASRRERMNAQYGENLSAAYLSNKKLAERLVNIFHKEEFSEQN